MVQWKGRRRSTNVEDRRGQSVTRRGGLKIGGIGTIVIVLLVVVMGGDPSQILSVLLGDGGGLAVPAPSGSGSGSGSVPRPLGDDDEALEFVKVILADTETTWDRLFSERGQQYPQPKLRLFSDAVDSACGFSEAAVGPFYCPPDRKVYLDLSFFDQLNQLGAPGDFAQAYVIGHEIGHHVQNVMGTLDRAQKAKANRSQADGNDIQVRIELQADCYAGVWAHHAEAQRDLLESGDIEEGLQAAAAIGDDTLQRRAGRRVQPESFTHGSSKARVQWFERGFETGKIDACDTFE